MVGLIVIIPLVIVVIIKSIVKVGENEIGLIKSGNKKIIVKSGYKFLFPFQIFRKLDVSAKTIDFNVNEIVNKSMKKCLIKSEIITKDKRSIKMNASYSYSVINGEMAICNLIDIEFAISQAAQVFIIKILKDVNYNEFINSKDRYSNEVYSFLNKLCSSWGIKIDEFCIKEVSL